MVIVISSCSDDDMCFMTKRVQDDKGHKGHEATIGTKAMRRGAQRNGATRVETQARQ
jgi:hypothetical protein